MSVPANQPVAVRPRTRASGAAAVTPATDPGAAGDRTMGRQAANGRAAVGEHDVGPDQRLRILVDNIIDALAPTNFALTNPVVLKTTIEKGGTNFVAGARAALRDAASPLRLPASVDRTGFAVGETVANSPGAVVRRDP